MIIQLFEAHKEEPNKSLREIDIQIQTVKEETNKSLNYVLIGTLS